MAHLVGDILAYLQFDDINIDNWHFKLYYKGATLIFMAGSMVGVLSQYFGDPIECDFTTIDSDVASDYCWIHGSSFIPLEYQSHMKCIADLSGVKTEDEAPDTSYYQWVVFMLLLQAGMFYLPYKLWRSMESGLIESFGKDAKAAVLLQNSEKMEGMDAMETVIEKYVKCFKAVLHHNQWYFFKFLLCEFLNVIFLILNFWITDIFLQGRFWYYGIDVIRWYMLSRAERKLVVSPFCATFPTEVSCTVPNIGAAGGEQHHNGMCVLSQNIINEKVYLIIWWYLSFVWILSVFFVIYRVCTLFFEPLRFGILYGKMSHKYDDEVRKSLKYVLSKCYLGDWFVLSQIAKNSNLYFLREFIKELRSSLQQKPKRSKSLSRNNSVTKEKAKDATLRKRDINESLLPDKADKNP